MNLASLKKTDIKNKKILLRTDYNVPLKNKKITDDSRILRSLETLQFLQKQAQKIIIISHLGRPQSEKETHLSLLPVSKHLSKLLNHKIDLLDSVEDINSSQNSIVMLENLRFFAGEEQNSVAFARQLADNAEVYINDAFSVSHRKHASVSAITRFLPSFPGFLFAKEYRYLKMLVTHPTRPFVTIVGGAKISTKVGVISKLSRISDIVLVGGGVANHFIKAEGFDVSASYLEKVVRISSHKQLDPVSVAGEIIEENKLERMLLDNYIPLPKILYPFDVVAADSITKPTHIEDLLLIEKNHQKERKELMFLDIGKRTQKLYSKIISQAGTVFWNGPLGLFESSEFSTGTKKIAHAIAKSPATTVVGGGDSIAAINTFGLSNRYDYVSASGGAALEFISGKQLPGLTPLLI